ncbi:MAG: DUF4198 domain-containing protein [Anaerolineae bacterium]|nr:DUF4198 domain-containing protein [Anaerolineae bacterium]NUQ05365.1 hypothetical protein [Anaerolineae bacterium]
MSRTVLRRIHPAGILALWTLLLLLLTACQGAASPTTGEVSFELVALEPDTQIVGEVTLVLRVLRGEAPLAGAQVAVQGDLRRAGVLPVQGGGQTDSAGVVRVPFEWTTGGDWVVTVTITTPDGQQRAGQFELTIAS